MNTAALWDESLQDLQAGNLQTAESKLLTLLNHDPSHSRAMHSLGIIAMNRQNLPAAINWLEKAIQHAPNSAEHHTALGALLRSAERLSESLASHDRAIALSPASPEAHYNRANALQDANRLDESIAAYQQALTLRPAYAVAHTNLAKVLQDQARLDEALTHYRQAITAAPRFPLPHLNYIDALHLHPQWTTQAILAEARTCYAQHFAPFEITNPTYKNPRQPDRRLRIGYVSPNFRSHPVGLQILPLLQHHDQTLFEIFCYADQLKEDHITQEMKTHTDHWQNIANLTDQQLAAQITNDQIDILIDTNIRLANSRLGMFARRPAPVQINYLAYPLSSGSTSLTHAITDQWIDPLGTHDTHYTEKLLTLPGSYWCHQSPPSPEVPPPPRTPNHPLTFGCLNNFQKNSPMIMQLWAKIMHELPDSRLLLLLRGGEKNNRGALESLQQNAIPLDRTTLLDRQPHDAYLKLFHQIDISLDPFPYGGHTTTLDSLAMGVPVITLIGNNAVSRAGYSMLHHLNLENLAASTPDQYVQIALDLARNPQKLTQLRADLPNQLHNSPLADLPAHTRQVEQAYRQAWQNWINES